MAIMKNRDGTEMYMDCCCGCNEGIRFKIDKDDFDYYCFMTYTNGNFFREQEDTLWGVFVKKLKKIWAIIRNKDFYYADVTMTKDEFDEFREYINSVNEEIVDEEITKEKGFLKKAIELFKEDALNDRIVKMECSTEDFKLLGYTDEEAEEIFKHVNIYA